MGFTNAKLSETIKVTQYDFDPDSSGTPVDVGWVDMTGYRKAMISIFRTVGTGDISSVSVLGNTTTTGSGTDITIKSVTISSQPDAVGDYLFIDVTQDDITAAEADSGNQVKGLSLAIRAETGTDELVVTYMLADPRNAQAGLSTDSIA